ncbi:MAG: YpdA family putative bacillithiol disulfide reductase [Deinococcales bacterium]|nr:YpdA family putative bacillithiol disulfide reductase [Deinococcales bacterium]
MRDLVIVGAGPIGLEAAILARRAGLDYQVVEKGAVVEAIRRYPTYMTFFTTADRLEVGGHPLVTATDKPTRKEALDYYRKVAAAEQLALRTYTEVVAIEPLPSGGFRVVTRPSGPAGVGAATAELRARSVVVATGYFDNPKLLSVPGEELPHVSHYYDEAHPYFGRSVVIVGAGSSAADAALDLHRAGARVTLVHRGDDLRHSLKYWIRPNLENRIKEGSITAHFRTTVKRITPEAVVVDKGGEELVVPADRVFALTGYFAAPELLVGAGVRVDPDTLTAELDPVTFESNVEGLFVIGSAGFGNRTSDVFIENGLLHARAAMNALVARLKGAPAPA